MKIQDIRSHAAARGLTISVIPSVLSIFKPCRYIELNGKFCLIEVLTPFHYKLESLDKNHFGLNFLIIANDLNTFVDKLSDASILMQGYICENERPVKVIL